MGVGLLLFWPALFALEGGDGPEAAEYARLKGEYEALRQAAVMKKISIHQLPPSPQKILDDMKSSAPNKNESPYKGVNSALPHRK